MFISKYWSSFQSKDKLKKQKQALYLPPKLIMINMSISRIKTNFCLESVDRFTNRVTVGKGIYGQIYKCTDRSANDELVAMKVMRLRYDISLEGFPSAIIREIAMLREVNHKNIVKLNNISIKDNQIYLIFEYLQQDLMVYMAKLTSAMSPRSVKLYLHSILSGVNECHSKKILHRDLKPANILIDSENNLKIADFGLARNWQTPCRPYSENVVTLWYRAPEILLGMMEYSTAVDIWSVGCIFAEMITGKVLFPGDSDYDQLHRIFKVLGTPTESIWPGVSKLTNYKTTFPKWEGSALEITMKNFDIDAKGLDLLNKLLKYDPKERISAKDALLHPYFNDLNRQ